MQPSERIADNLAKRKKMGPSQVETKCLDVLNQHPNMWFSAFQLFYRTGFTLSQIKAALLCVYNCDELRPPNLVCENGSGGWKFAIHTDPSVRLGRFQDNSVNLVKQALSLNRGTLTDIAEYTQLTENVVHDILTRGTDKWCKRREDGIWESFRPIQQPTWASIVSGSSQSDHKVVTDTPYVPTILDRFMNYICGALSFCAGDPRSLPLLCKIQNLKAPFCLLQTHFSPTEIQYMWSAVTNFVCSVAMSEMDSQFGMELGSLLSAAMVMMDDKVPTEIKEKQTQIWIRGLCSNHNPMAKDVILHDLIAHMDKLIGQLQQEENLTIYLSMHHNINTNNHKQLIEDLVAVHRELFRISHQVREANGSEN